MIKNIALCTLLSFGLIAEEPVDYDRLSVALGHLLVKHIQESGFECNIDKVVQGIREEQKGKPSPMGREEYEQIVFTLQERELSRMAEENLEKATAFLDSNREKPGVQNIDSKLQYRVAKEGSGIEVKEESIPLIHYKGTLLDGTPFAASDQPIALPITQSIPGVSKGVVGMKEGERRVLYIHPELAYGTEGELPPNSLLIFEVEVVKADATEALAQK